jgi:hypothetical protein
MDCLVFADEVRYSTSLSKNLALFYQDFHGAIDRTTQISDFHLASLASQVCSIYNCTFGPFWRIEGNLTPIVLIEHAQGRHVVGRESDNCARKEGESRNSPNERTTENSIPRKHAASRHEIGLPWIRELVLSCTLFQQSFNILELMNLSKSVIGFHLDIFSYLICPSQIRSRVTNIRLQICYG